MGIFYHDTIPESTYTVFLTKLCSLFNILYYYSRKVNCVITLKIYNT